MSRLGSGAAGASKPLTSREREVLEMVVLGLTNEQIASRVSLSTHTVKFHLASLYAKLGVANRTEAAVAYTRRIQDGGDLIEPSGVTSS